MDRAIECVAVALWQEWNYCLPSTPDAVASVAVTALREAGWAV